MMNSLIGDIGGTKTILALYSDACGPFKPLAEKSYPSARYASLADIICEFRAEFDQPVDRAVFGVAGPVFSGHAHITNLPWEIDSLALRQAFGWRAVGLLNDLEAVANAIPILRPEDLFTLNPGKPVPGGSLAVLAPGTGLGEAYMTWDGGEYRAHPCEGSHVSFGPVGSLQIGLLQYMNRQGYDHVSYERVCSGGLGIPNLYAYLKTTGLVEPAWLAEQLACCEDATPVILTAAYNPDKPCPLADATLDLFVAILGAEAGNLALKILATGGIYLGGGIPPRILTHLQKPAFREALRSKGRFYAMLADMPVHVILNAKAGLAGAAAFGLKLPAA